MQIATGSYGRVDLNAESLMMKESFACGGKIQ
jgi:hypothetical protein